MTFYPLESIGNQEVISTVAGPEQMSQLHAKGLSGTGKYGPMEGIAQGI